MSDDIIKRSEAIKAIENLHDCYNGFSDTYDKACIIGVLEEVPRAQSEIIRCIDCIHYTPLGKDKAWGRCSVHSSPTENQRMCQSCDFCAWAERRTDD